MSSVYDRKHAMGGGGCGCFAPLIFMGAFALAWPLWQDWGRDLWWRFVGWFT